MSKSKRKTVTQILNEDLLGLLDTKSLDGAILDLDDLKVAYSNYYNLRIQVKHCYECAELHLLGDRLETDAEYNKRIKKESAARERTRKKNLKELLNKEDGERKLLKKLLEKYGAE